MFTKEAMTARYLELDKQRKKIRAKSDPIRAQRDKLVGEHQPKEVALNERLKAAEKGLFEIDSEAALIAKALGNETPALT